MKNNKHSKSIDTTLENFINGSVPFNTAFAHNIAQALIKYQKDKGLPFPQDVIRLAVFNFLSKSGYINNNS